MKMCSVYILSVTTDVCAFLGTTATHYLVLIQWKHTLLANTFNSLDQIMNPLRGVILCVLC